MGEILNWSGNVGDVRVASGNTAYLYYGAQANNIRIDRGGVMFVQADGWKEPIVTGTITVAGQITGNGEISDKAEFYVVWDISDGAMSDGPMIRDMDDVASMHFSINVAADQDQGTYFLADGLKDYLSGVPITVSNVPVSYLPVGQTVPVGDRQYTLTRESKRLYLTVSGGTIKGAVRTYKGNSLVSAANVMTGKRLNSWGSDGDNMHVTAGGTANDTIVNGGSLAVSNGGTANETYVDTNGGMTVYSGGTANETYVDYGGLLAVSNGGTANETYVDTSGGMTVYSGGTANDTIVDGGYVALSGGTANRTEVNFSGGMTVFGGGTANETAVDSSGVLTVSEGGIAAGAIVDGGGLAVLSGGTAAGVVENGGYVYAADGANVTFAQNIFSGEVSSATVHSGTTANSTFITPDGLMDVFSGGLVNSATVNAGGHLNIHDGGKLTGQMTFESGAVVAAYSGSIIDFDISGRSAGEAALLNDLSFVGGAPGFTVTVSAAQEEGRYALAAGAADFAKTVTVSRTDGAAGTLSVGGTITLADQEYTLLIKSDMLSLNVGPVEPDGPPDAPTATADITGPTNRNVTVTARFDYGSTGRYSFDGGEWTDYTGPVVMESNGTVFFQAWNALGCSDVTQVVVDNIDKAVPVIYAVDWSGEQTYRPVTVYTSISDGESGLASTAYSFDGGEWTGFDGTFQITKSGTFTILATDRAGNQTVSGPYAVTNILADETAPVIYAVDWNGEPAEGAVTVYVAAFDNESGLVSTEYSFNGGEWTFFGGTFDVATNGTFAIRATDYAGNQTVSGLYAVTNVQVDEAAPVIYAVDWNGAWTNGPVTVYTAIFDEMSGVASTEYSFDGGEWTAFEGTFDVTKNGTFSIRAADYAGNTSVSDLYAVTNIGDDTDPTPPVIYAVDWNGAWTKEGPVTVYTAIFDEVSGLAATEYSFEGGDWTPFDRTFEVTENGTFAIRAADNAGNQTVSGLYAVTNIGDAADPTPPVIYAVDWNGEPTKEPVTVYTAIFDEVSGIASTEYSFDGEEWTAFDGSFVVTENSIFTIRAADNAGNTIVSAPYWVSNIVVDQTAPSIYAVWNGAPTNGPLTIYTAIFDSESGIAKTEYSFDDGEWTAFDKTFVLPHNGTFVIRATDNTGNQGFSELYGIDNIDLGDQTAPVIYAVDWNGAWTNGPVTVYTAIFDTEIGVEKTEYSFNGGAWTAFDGSFDVTENGTFTIRAIDNAGNRSFSALYAVTNIGVSADQAPPVIYAVDWNGEPTGGPVTVYTAIFDAESGMAKTEYSFNGGEWTAFDGTFDVTENGVFTIRATDNAENEAFSEQLAITNIADGLTAELSSDASAPFAAGSALWDADTGLAGFDGLSDWDTAAFLSDADILKFDRNGSQVSGMLA